MSKSSPLSSATVKRRQYLLLGGIGAAIIGAALFSVTLSGSRDSGEKPAKPKSVNILAPGGQVDPKDAWRGQADAQLHAMEQKSRDLVQRDTELSDQNKEMLERLKKLEGGGLTPLPPPPVMTPPLRPNFGPDKPSLPVDNGAKQLPPPPGGRAGSSMGAGGGAGGGMVNQAPPVSILTITVSNGALPGQAKAPVQEAKADTKRQTTARYIPSGTFTRAILLGGLDAPTGGQAQRDPQPVLLRLVDNAVLPNQFRSQVKECFVVGAGYGDVSSERAYIRTESLSCVTRDGTALDIKIKGYIAGEDGKAGMRGRLVSKQGQILANALLAGVASGIGHAFQQSATTVSISPLGATSAVDTDKQLQAGLGSGVGKALDRLAQYYITLAEKVFPVIEIDAGRTVDVVVTQGVALPGPLDSTNPDGSEYSQLTQRNNNLRRTQDEDE